MEYIAGQTLDKLIPAGGLSKNAALKYAVQIAEALSSAQDQIPGLFEVYRLQTSALASSAVAEMSMRPRQAQTRVCRDSAFMQKAMISDPISRPQSRRARSFRCIASVASETKLPRPRGDPRG